MSYKILVINPGSTSTKISLFEDEKELFESSVTHDAEFLLSFPNVNAELPYRRQVIEQFLKEHGVDLHEIDAYAARGGSSFAQESGVYEVNEKLIEDTVNAVGGVHHASNLAVQIADEFRKEYGGRAFTLDAISVDEYEDVARLTGIRGFYRKATAHVLNQKGIIRKHCEKYGLQYEEHNFIVCHIDGGITISAHKRGKMVDGNNGGNGDGPYTPTRIGSLSVLDVLEYEKEHSTEDVQRLVMGAGGFVSYFGTSDSDEVHRKVEEGDPEAQLVWEGLIYNIAKSIGSMAAVLCGEVDGIVLTGRLLRFADVEAGIRRRCGFIAPVYTYPGEVEQEALALGALRVLRGEEIPKIYTGRPVWNGFDFCV